MREPASDETKSEVRQIYQNIDDILKQKDMKWQDLAAIIGLKPKTLSSMKSQNQNMSVLTVRNIAKALDVSIDELVDNSYGMVEDLKWLIDNTFPVEKRTRVYSYLVSACQVLADGDDVLNIENVRKTRLNDN